MTAATLADVVKRFGSTVALDGVSLEVGDAELLALVGPSGCGKSTLLRSIAGLVALDAGTVTVDGAVVDDGRTALPPERRNVGLVFQEHALFPHLTVAGNVAFGLREGSRSSQRERVAEVLGLVGLDDFGERFPHEISGGERQRVALARALAPSPGLLLLDEPFASLDPNLRTRLRADVSAILRSSGTPAVFVTHDQLEAMAVGDRVAVMRSGRLLQVDAPYEVFHTPGAQFVASFMGEADFLPLDGDRCELGPVPGGSSAPAGALAMVRPDDVAFSPSDRGDAVITAREFRGGEWCWTLELASGSTVRSLRSHLDRATIGDRVDVALHQGHEPVVVPAASS